jgi:hypothetical protein
VSILAYTGGTSDNTQSLHSESLPDEDPDTQAILVKRVLEILMEIKNLTPAEKVSVQDNIAGLHSHTLATFTQPGQQRYVLLFGWSYENDP